MSSQDSSLKNMASIEIYTDGSAKGNPNGPGGYGVLLRYKDPDGRVHERHLSAGYRRTTNNRMELLAVIVGLEAIKWEHAEVEVWSDSSYVVKAINEGWLESWKRKGFKGKKNMDLWIRFDEVFRRHTVRFHWLKGHAGHPENERCDTLAVEAYHGENLPEDTGYTEKEEQLF